MKLNIFSGDSMPYSGTFSTRNVSVESVYMTMSVSPNPPWKNGQEIEIVVGLYRGEEPYSGKEIVVFIYPTGDYDNAGVNILCRGYTDSNGIYRQKCTMPTYGLTYDGKALLFPCRNITLWAVQESLQIGKAVTGDLAFTTSISISAPDTVTAGSYFGVYGKLEYLSDTATGAWKPLANRQVKIYYDSTLIGTVTTNSNGEFSAQAKIDAPGNYTLKATYDGEGWTTSAISVATMSIGIPNELADCINYTLALSPLIAVGGTIVGNEIAKMMR